MEKEKLCEREGSLSSSPEEGYRQLAFGSISDAVSLLYKEEPTVRELAKMDLFSISEIKRARDGAMEIKFYDRLKALEKLEISGNVNEGASSLLDAINRSARSDGSEAVEN